ncbi:hypothetical protein BDW02DRAFT_499116 [Decorospora gaudefroyi]|uniref:Uncharacterized protein n=1 Tax=Decorospora gaudefroyi TaxID=184978 RepID=A0A6A5KKY9_9PLEO|nr:hypothetical protein BDW02DRAFT_499116 [Decorospora gaudefroyi]
MFYSVPNPKVGILIAFYTNTPNAIATGNGVDLVRYPPLALCHWSDVAFLQWASLSVEGVIPDLKFVARVSISNEHTIAVLQTVLSKLRKEQRAPENRLPTWPGINFPMETEEAKALLGTPNGAGIAWLLAQHKKELGHKTVETVRLWYSKYVGTPNLLFHLKNVEAPGLTDGPTKAASPFALTS